MSGNIHLQWTGLAGARFFTGVSLHSHTLHSRESLDFIYRAGERFPPLAAAIREGERRYYRIHGARLDLTRAWWTPPLGPFEAWSVEKSQIENLDLNPLVSLTDHDDIEGPVSLHVLEDCRQTPVSVEWTVPSQSTFFHLGVHNLPSSRARTLLADMQTCRQRANESQLGGLLAELAAIPQVLLILNHPLWDEKGIGPVAHQQAARALLHRLGPSLHALELNGLRPWRENRDVIALALATSKPVISGGDRHALEPNAILNLTNAHTFAEFVEEVRSGWSDVAILSHYREAYASRIVHNMIDVLRNYDRHANGWRLWSDRVFYEFDDGNVQSLRQLFGERTPLPIAVFVGALHLASEPRIRGFLRRAYRAEEEVIL